MWRLTPPDSKHVKPMRGPVAPTEIQWQTAEVAITNKKSVLLIVALLGLPACGRDEAASAPPASAATDAAKGGAKGAGRSEEMPRVPDPMKEGY